MQDQAVTVFMTELNYTTTWNATRGYPILQAQATGNEQPPRTVTTIEATNATSARADQIPISITVATSDSDSSDGFVITIQDTDGLSGLDNATAVTDQDGTATFSFSESNANSYKPTFGVAGDTAVSTTANIIVKEGAVRTYTREDGTNLTGTYIGSGTPDDPYLANSLTDLQVINKNATTRDEHYQLTDDINASATIESWNSGNGFEPIANATDEAFTGTLRW
jgi:hypothetical protein